MLKILYITLAISFLGLFAYLLSVDSVELPSSYGSYSSILTPPTTYFMAVLPLTFAISLILYVINRDKYKKLCGIFATTGVVFLFVGLVIVAPLLKALSLN